MDDHSTTRPTMFERLRSPESAAAWRDFEMIYSPMLLRFCRSRGLQHADAEDVVQAVLTRFMHGVERFEYDPSRGRFRDYLFSCTRNALANHLACQKRASGQVLPSAGAVPDRAVNGELEAEFERQWLFSHFRRALEHIRADMSPKKYLILHDALRRRPVSDIAAEHGISEAGVYKVLERVRVTLRQRIARQIADEDGVR